MAIQSDYIITFLLLELTSDLPTKRRKHRTFLQDSVILSPIENLALCSHLLKNHDFF